MLKLFVLPHYPTPKRPRFDWKCSRIPIRRLPIDKETLVFSFR